MAFDESAWVWMDGTMTPWRDATVHVSAHTLHYGTGVFEGIRCYRTDHGPAVFRLRDHVERLLASAAVHGLAVPYSCDELRTAVFDVIARNGLESCYVRPLCYYGTGSLDMLPGECPVRTAVLAWPCEPLFGAAVAERGVSATISSWRKFHSTTTPTTAKACGQYVNSVLAAREARQRGKNEALLLNADGTIAEGAGDNLFLVRNGTVVTNDARHSILLGITRDSILQIAATLGVQAEVRPMTAGDLLSADEAFLTGTAVEIAPIREVDGTPVGTQCPGPVTRAIAAAFTAAVHGRDPLHADWCERVEPSWDR